MNGRLVTKWLPPIFTHRYEPFGLVLDEPIQLTVERGRICGIDGDPKLVTKVRDHYERILGVVPRSPEALRGLALARMRLGESEAAARLLEEALRIDPEYGRATALIECWQSAVEPTIPRE